METKHFKVGTFNLYNLALAGERYYNRSYRQDAYEKKVHWLANQLKKMHADIVGFQEIFHIAALKEVLQASGIYDQASVSVGERKGEGPAVGLVSRFPILDHDIIPEFPEGSQLEIDDVAVPDRFGLVFRQRRTVDRRAIGRARIAEGPLLADDITLEIGVEF